jgi:hypothetical protein
MDEIKMIKNKVHSVKKQPNEIYISGKRVNYEKFYYKRVYKLIYDDNLKEIHIHGLGACVNKAVRIALFITDCIPSLTVSSIDTSTVNLTDDFIDSNHDVKEF